MISKALAYWEKIHEYPFPVLTKTDNYTVTTDDIGYLLLMNATTLKTFTLPNLDASYNGKRIRITSINTGRVKVQPYSGGTINNSSYILCLEKYDVIELMLVGANTWIIFSTEGKMSDSWELGPYVGYSYYKNLTIPQDKVSGNENLLNFPVVFSDTWADLRTIENGGHVSNDNGYDIIFTDQYNRQLAHEIESYTNTSGQFIAWVRIPILKSSSDTVIKIHYGNSGVSSSQENVSGTFSNSFMMIHHMDDASGTVVDSLGSYSSTAQYNLSYAQTGKINKSILFNESNAYYTIADFDYEETFTISLWLKVTDNTGSAFQYFFSHDYGTNNAIFCYLAEDGVAGPDQTRIRFYDDDSTLEEMLAEPPTDVNATDGEWHLIHIVRVANGTSMLIIDGELQDSISSSNVDINPVGLINIGRRDDNDPNRYFGGNLAELRIANTNRTLAWCTTEFINQNDPANFFLIK